MHRIINVRTGAVVETNDTPISPPDPPPIPDSSLTLSPAATEVLEQLASLPTDALTTVLSLGVELAGRSTDLAAAVADIPQDDSSRAALEIVADAVNVSVGGEDQLAEAQQARRVSESSKGKLPSYKTKQELSSPQEESPLS